MKPEKAPRYRTEREPLGENRVSERVLYGIHNLRALENFEISNVRMDQSADHRVRRWA